MRTYWVTLVSASAALLFVGLVVGLFVGTANDQGDDCGTPFVSAADQFGGDAYGPDCAGARAQARQLPVALLLLGASGLAGAGIGNVIVTRAQVAVSAASDD